MILTFSFLITDLGLFPSFGKIANGMSILLIHFKTRSLIHWFFCIFCLSFINFCFNFYNLITSTSFGFECFKALRCFVRLFILASSVLMRAFMAISFVLMIAAIASYEIWYDIQALLFDLKNCLIAFWICSVA